MTNDFWLHNIGKYGPPFCFKFLLIMKLFAIDKQSLLSPNVGTHVFDCFYGFNLPKIYHFGAIFFQKITHNKEISVAGVMHFHNGILHWDVQFSRLVQEWGLESLTAFMDLMYSRSEKGDGLDKLCWRPAKSRGFDVCSCYHSLSSPWNMSFPWKLGWRSKIPPWVAFFSWTAALGKI